MLRPVTLSRGHSSCLECLAKLVATTEKPSRPLCRMAFANDDTLNVNVALNTLTRNLEVACTNDNCGWTGTYERAEDHSKQCAKKKVRCLNEDCQHVLTNEELALHLLICDKQLVSCPDCGLYMAKDMLAHHLSELCLYKGICCPLGCGEILPRYFVILISFPFGTLISLLIRKSKKKKREAACETVTVNEANDWNKCANGEVSSDLLMLTRESEELVNCKHSEFYECWNYTAFPRRFHLKYRKCALTLADESVKLHPFQRKVTWPFIR